MTAVRRLGLSVAMALMAALPLHGSAQFRSIVDGVSVDVEVLRNDVPVPGLVAYDFALVDNGVAQQINVRLVDAMPIDVTLVMDTSGSTVDAIARVKKDVPLIAAQVRSQDRLRLVTFAGSFHEVFGFQASATPFTLDQLASVGGTALNDTMLYVLSHATEPERRQLIVVFTDGNDTNSALEDGSIVDSAKRSDAVLNAILFAPTSFPDNPSSGHLLASREALTTAVGVTGGDTLKLEDAVDGFRRIFEAFRHRYVLQYTLQGVARPGWHRILVNVPTLAKDPVFVRSREGYFGGS